MTKRKDPEVLPAERKPEGRPSKYRGEFCQLLIDHTRQGNSFESFGHVAQVSVATLYTWLREHPEFLEARSDAEGSLHKFYEDMGKMLATGQLRRLKSEEPMIGPDGKPVLDPKGNVLMKREYEHVTGSATAWIFLTKNMLGWSDKRMVAFGKLPEESESRRARDLTPDERMREIAEMTAALAELDEHGDSDQSA